jgi:glucose/arabinose dehydrogenase
MSRARSAAVAAALAALALAGCGGGDDGDAEREPRTAAEPPATAETAERPPPRERRERLARSDGGPEVSVVASGLEVPWELAFLPDGRALVTERPGRVRLLGADGELREEPVAEVDVDALGEGGLLGLAVDPAFRRNSSVYLYRTRGEANEIVRYRLDGERLVEERVVVDGIRGAAIHDGGRLRFGPDGDLYATTGDAADPELSQDPRSLNGKLLRLDARAARGGGGRPQVVSTCHRNPQGLDWQPRTGRLYSNEHGPDGDDEVNLIRPRANYGWPRIRGDQGGDGLERPIAVYPDSIAPSGATFVRLPGSAWSGDYLIGCLVGEQIRRVRFDGSRVTLDEPLFEGEFGRLRTVVEGPDGALYALTNNRDGRGAPREDDDRILRIVPPAR